MPPIVSTSLTAAELTAYDRRRHRWVVPFLLDPAPHQGGGLDTSRCLTVPVGGELIELLGVEELITYLRLALWHQRGEESNIDRLAEECWSGQVWRADTWVSALVEKDLIVEGDKYARVLAVEREEQREAETGPVRETHGPSYCPGRWTGVWPVIADTHCPYQNPSGGGRPAASNARGADVVRWARR